MLAEAQESGQILDEEQLAFLVDPSILDGQAAQTTIPNIAAFQTEDLDAYDSDCNDVSNAKAVLMANRSNYGSDVILEVPHFEPYHTDLDNQSVHAMQGFEQTLVVDFTDNKITNDSNIILYSQYLQEIQQMDDMIKERLALKQQINSLEQNLSNQIKENAHVHEAISFYDDTHKQALGYQNPFYLKKAQRIKPTLYDGSVITSQHAASPVIDDEETLILEELQTSHPNTDQSASSPVKIEAPKELLKVSLVNTILKKLRYHLGQFDIVVKKRITRDAITEGEWGFEHTKVVFLKEIIPF
ncbi:hypothetical protein Tco_0045245 [Tanacetum coccineum]